MTIRLREVRAKVAELTSYSLEQIAEIICQLELNAQRDDDQINELCRERQELIEALKIAEQQS